MRFAFVGEANVLEGEGEVGFEFFESSESSLKDFRSEDQVTRFVREGEDGRKPDDVVLLAFEVPTDEGVVKRDLPGFFIPPDVPVMRVFGERESSTSTCNDPQSVNQLSFKRGIIRDRKRKDAGCRVSRSHESPGKKPTAERDCGNTICKPVGSRCAEHGEVDISEFNFAFCAGDILPVIWTIVECGEQCNETFIVLLPP